jgi:hypothetical protein
MYSAAYAAFTKLGLIKLLTIDVKTALTGPFKSFRPHITLAHDRTSRAVTEYDSFVAVYDSEVECYITSDHRMIAPKFASAAFK